MKKILFYLLAFCSLALSAIELKNAVIYCSKNAPPSVQKAALELQTHLYPVLGKKLQIVHRPQSPMIVLGDCSFARYAGIDTSKFEYEQYRILTKDGNLLIVGKDLKNDAPTEFGGSGGGRSFGTLYAVYDFLEKQIGISWLIPGPKGIWYPPQNPDLKIESLDISFKPHFLMRQIIGLQNQGSLVSGWFAFNRFDNRWIAGPAYWPTQHTWPHLYPKENAKRKGREFLKSREATFRDNPEFFQLSKDGKRVYPSGRVSLCITNPAVIADIAARNRALAAGSKNKYPYLFLTPTDGTPNCYCKNCQSAIEILDPKTVGATGLHFVKMSWTKPVLNYYRSVCEQVPHVLFRGVIYQRYEFQPKEPIKKMPDNMIAGMAPLQTGYGPVRLYPPVNETWKKWEKSWRGVFKRQIYQSLEFWLRQAAGAPMSPYPAILKDTFKAMNENPSFVGFYVYMNKGYGHSSLFNWMILQLMWDHTQDPDKLMDTFLVKAYGGAAEDIRKFYDVVDKNMTAFVSSCKGKIGYNLSLDLLKKVYAADWEHLESLYLAGITKKMDENQKWRLAMLGENLKLLRYHLSHFGLIPDKSSPLRMTPQEFQLFNKRRLPGGDLYMYVNSPYITDHLKHATLKLDSVKTVDASEIKNREKSKYSSYYQYGQDIIVYADKNGQAEFEMEFDTNKNPGSGKKHMPDIGYYTVIDKTGKIYYHDMVCKNKISFPAHKGEYYYLYFTPLGDHASFTRWKLKSASMPFAFGTRLKMTGLMAYALKDPIYFYVKEGVSEITIYFDGMNQHSEVIAPDGTKNALVKSKQNSNVKIKTPAAGWWKITFLNPNGYHGSVKLSNNLDGFFVIDPDMALDVKTGKENVWSAGNVFYL